MPGGSNFDRNASRAIQQTTGFSMRRKEQTEVSGHVENRDASVAVSLVPFSGYEGGPTRVTATGSRAMAWEFRSAAA